MMSHNMYVDVFFALKNNVLKQMLNVWIPSTKASNHKKDQIMLDQQHILSFFQKTIR